MTPISQKNSYLIPAIFLHEFGLTEEHKIKFVDAVVKYTENQKRLKNIWFNSVASTTTRCFFLNPCLAEKRL